MNKEDMDKLWREVEYVGEVENLDHGAMLVLGSAFGKMRAEINRLNEASNNQYNKQTN